MHDQQQPTHPSNNVTLDNVDDVFEYHAPKDLETRGKYAYLRRSAKHFALEILRVCPPCADRTAAIRKLRETLMTANAAIALEPRAVEPGGGDS